MLVEGPLADIGPLLPLYSAHTARVVEGPSSQNALNTDRIALQLKDPLTA